MPLEFGSLLNILYYYNDYYNYCLIKMFRLPWSFFFFLLKKSDMENF